MKINKCDLNKAKSSTSQVKEGDDTTLLESNKIVDKATNNQQIQKNVRPLVNESQVRPDSNYRNSKLQSHTVCKSSSSALSCIEKQKKSKLTLPNKPTPVRRCCTVGDVNDTDYESTISNLNTLKTTIPNTRGQTRSGALNTNDYRRELKSFNSESSPNQLKRYAGDAKMASRRKKVDDIKTKEENHKFHEVWSLLRDMNAFDFKSTTTPRISEVSLVVPRKKVNNSRRYVTRPPSNIVPTRDIYNGSYRNDFLPIKFEDAHKIKTTSSDRFSITKEIYLSKTAKNMKSKKIRKPVNDRQKYNIQSNRKVSESAANTSTMVNSGSTRRSARTKKKCKGRSTKKSLSPSNSDFTRTDVTALHSNVRNKATFKKPKKFNNSSINLDESFDGSLNLSTTRDSPKKVNEQSRGGLKQSTQQNSTENRVHDYQVLKNNFWAHPTANKRKLRLNTTIPSPPRFPEGEPRLNVAEIKRKVAHLQFPLVILGRNEVSSTLQVPDYDPLQFQGLEDHIWPFMRDWTRKKSPTKVSGDSRVNNSEVVSTKVKVTKEKANKEVNTGIISAQQRRDMIQYNKQIISRKIKDNMLKLIFKKPSEYHDNAGDFSLQNYLDVDTTAVTLRNKDFPLDSKYSTFEESMIPIEVTISSTKGKSLTTFSQESPVNFREENFMEASKFFEGACEGGKPSKIYKPKVKYHPKQLTTTDNARDFIQINKNALRDFKNRYTKDTPKNSNMITSTRRTLYASREKTQPHTDNFYITQHTLYARGETNNREMYIAKHSYTSKSPANSTQVSLRSVKENVRSARDNELVAKDYRRSMITPRESLCTVHDSKRTSKASMCTLTPNDEMCSVRSAVTQTQGMSIKTAKCSALSSMSSAFMDKFSVHTSAGTGDELSQNSYKQIAKYDTSSANYRRNAVRDISAKDSWLSTKNKKIGTESKSLFNSVNVPEYIHNSSFSDRKRDKVIVKNAIRMLELGFFYDGEFVNTPKKTVQAINSIDTLVQKNSDFIKEDSENLQMYNKASCEVLKVTKIPGFENINNLPDFEIKTLNENEVAIKNCNENITIQFDVADPSESQLNSIESLIFDELPGLSASNTHISAKILKCKSSLFNSVLPAELCTMIPSIMRKMLSPKQNTLIQPTKVCLLPMKGEPVKSESKFNNTPPKILPFVISPELIKYRHGCYTNVQKHRQTKQFTEKEIFSCCLFSMHNVKVAQEMLSQIKFLFSFNDCCPDLMNPKPKLKENQSTSTALIARKNPTKVIDFDRRYMNKMMQIMNDHKLTFHFIYDFSNDVMNIKVNCKNELSDTKGLVPYSKNLEESITIVNCKVKSIIDLMSKQNFTKSDLRKYFSLASEGTCEDIKLLPIETHAARRVKQIKEVFEKKSKEWKFLTTNGSSKTKDTSNKVVLNVESHRNQVAKGLSLAINKSSKSIFRMLYRKCKSSSSVIYTPIRKINKLDDFFHAMGAATGLSAAIDGNTGEKLISSVLQMKDWVSEITPRQALLVLLLANKKTTLNLIKFRSILLQAIAVNRITTASELDTEIEVLEKERFKMAQLQNEEVMYPTSAENQNDLYEELCWIAKTTASDYQKTFDESSEKLLKTLLAKRKKLNPSYLRVMARYVGLGLLKSPVKSN